MSGKTSEEAGLMTADLEILIRLKLSDACKGGDLSIEIRAFSGAGDSGVCRVVIESLSFLSYLACFALVR